MMNDLYAERDRFYNLSQKVLQAHDATTFTELTYKAFDNLRSGGLTDEMINRVLLEFTPYYRYWEFRNKGELQNEVIKNASKE